jgi:hypothetical protein
LYSGITPKWNIQIFSQIFRSAYFPKYNTYFRVILQREIGHVFNNSLERALMASDINIGKPLTASARAAGGVLTTPVAWCTIEGEHVTILEANQLAKSNIPISVKYHLIQA